jgi:A/G-specific adenine glycosylase
MPGRNKKPAPAAAEPGQLYRWYSAHKRDLPFRRTRAVYAIWVSEVMLQQTRVAAMLPRYQAFTTRFPDLVSLARADQNDVLAAWQGLGYYSRARNLHRGARYIIEECGGVFPGEWQAALAVPGVGPYTAAAILSICMDLPVAVLDGNVKRVLGRLLGPGIQRASGPGSSFHVRAVSDGQLAGLADRLIEDRGDVSPGDHNQALMELGALVCTPGRPDCARCPLQTNCVAFRYGGPELAATIPPRRPKPETVDLELDAFLIYNARRTKLLIARENRSRFFRDLWFFPYRFRGAVYFDPAASPGLTALLRSPLIAELDHLPGDFRHTITHHRIRGRVLHGRASGQKASSGSEAEILRKLHEASAARNGANVEWRWLPRAALHETVVSSLARKIEKLERASETPKSEN